MIKTHFSKELLISGTQAKNSSANTKADVLKIQSWLNLYAVSHPSSGTATGIDGDFGPSTEMAVKNFQKALGIEQSGTVTAEVFAKLCKPLSDAFQLELNGDGLRSLIVSTAHQHLDQRPFELVIKTQANSGPWVRSYLDGYEGDIWFWCAGFVQAIVDQAASHLNKSFKTLMPLTYSCDTLGATASQKKLLIKNKDIRNNSDQVKPGDIFLLQKSALDWYHTGIITAVHKDYFETIEGNTNTDGSHNGNGVYKRTRNYQKQLLDVFSIEPLV